MNRFRSPKSQSGQIVVLLIISLLTMVLTVGLIFNTGQQIHWKTQTQNAVDSGAISHGTNVARSLNVMSVNNVAITQAFTLNVLMANLVPELTDSTYKALEGITSYILGGISACGSYDWVNCGLNAAALVRMLDILADLEDIWDQIGSFLDPSKVEEAHAVVQALESMNNQLYENFSNSAANMTERLGYLNNLDEAPVFIGGGAFYSNKVADLTAPNYNSTWLPVEKTVTIESASAPETSSSIGAATQDFGLCITGYEGTPIDLLRAFGNFEALDYETGEGPYPIGRDRFNTVLEAQVDNIEEMLEEIPGATQFDVEDDYDFEDLVEIAYPLACSLQRLMQVAVFVPLPSDSFTLYKASLPVIDTSNEQNSDWSIFAIARKEQATGFVGKDLFQNPIKGHYAYAQAEVYNPVWYDLYTQDWTVKLQPATMVVDLHPDFVDAISSYFPEIEPALRHGVLKYNNH